MIDRIVLASNNKGKLAELRAMFAPLGILLVPQGELGVPEAAEPHRTFVENALAKARNAAQHSGLPAIADDAGLCVEAFGGLPCALLSGRHLTWYGPSLAEAPRVLGEALRAALR